jgi:hypothetical protein
MAALKVKELKKLLSPIVPILKQLKEPLYGNLTNSERSSQLATIKEKRKQKLSPTMERVKSR